MCTVLLVFGIRILVWTFKAHSRSRQYESGKFEICESHMIPGVLLMPGITFLSPYHDACDHGKEARR